MSDKRQQLMTTAYRLFNRHGFHANGIDRIWAEAGSTKRTLYRHFPTKDALIEAVLMARDAEFFALLDARMDGVTFEKVRDIVVEQLGVEPDEVAIDSTFIDDLGADSLDIVELIMAFEEEFNIEIPDEAAEKIKTVQDVVTYIDQHKDK